MDLESPTTVVCPLHAALGEPHTVEIKENNSEKPYFQCEDLKTTVNLHADDAEDYARELRDVTERTGMLDEPPEGDESEEAEETAERNTLADILGDNDE